LVRAQLEAHGLNENLIRSLSTTVTPDDGTRSIMVMSWDLKSGGLFSHFATACRQALESLGFSCTVVDCGADHHMKQRYVREALRHRYSGVVLAGVPGAYPTPQDEVLMTIQPLTEASIPVALLMPWNGHVSLPQGVVALGWDADVANGMAVEALRSAGHEDIALVLSETGPLVSGRYQGLDRVFADVGKPLNDISVAWVGGDPDDLEEVQHALNHASAVFARPSTLPVLANACYALGRHWPADISVMTIGHPITIPQLGSNPFTYVTVPVGKISRGAAHILASLIEDNEVPYSQQFMVYGKSSMRIMNAEGGSVGAPVTR
jgi:DNA-binding LacI/PurR family transcriptional regulator